MSNLAAVSAKVAALPTFVPSAGMIFCVGSTGPYIKRRQLLDVLAAAQASPDATDGLVPDSTDGLVRPDDGNWRGLSSREREYLEKIEREVRFEKARADQLGINCRWMIDRLDQVCSALAPEFIGSWQNRANKAVELAEAISRNKGRP